MRGLRPRTIRNTAESHSPPPCELDVRWRTRLTLVVASLRRPEAPHTCEAFGARGGKCSNPPEHGGGGRMKRLAMIAAAEACLSALAGPALAQQEVQDREELDRAAGRLVFRNDPFAQTNAFQQQQVAQVQTAQVTGTGRRQVRVILASPYGQ